nr:hypothetical protein [Tanacetum cinerariifolium]
MKPFMCKQMMNSLKKELKQIEADDQTIQTILLGLPEDIYAAVDSGEGSGSRGEVVELGWNGGSWWEKCWRENRAGDATVDPI